MNVPYVQTVDHSKSKFVICFDKHHTQKDYLIRSNIVPSFTRNSIDLFQNINK